MANHVRPPAVAGQFYPDEPEELTSLINASFLHRIGPGSLPPAKQPCPGLLGLVSPHAGYVYSGPVAAHGYLAASTPESLELAVIVGPNHWGIGSGVATFKHGAWRTPLGVVDVDEESAETLVRDCGIVDFDELAHRNEHSIEVQIPFLQRIFHSGFKILPICMAMQDRTTSVEIGKALADVVRGKRFLIIASSDFTHYENSESASRKDLKLIDAICRLDTGEHYAAVQRLDVSICGYGPIAATMEAVKALGGREGRLLKYATSGDLTGRHESVVGYASIAFLR